MRTNNFASVSGCFTSTGSSAPCRTWASTCPPTWPTPCSDTSGHPLLRCSQRAPRRRRDGRGSATGYGTMDSSIAGDPLGRACDPRAPPRSARHGISTRLWTAQYGLHPQRGRYALLIYFDPDSNCRGVDGTPVGKPGDLRFTTSPGTRRSTGAATATSRPAGAWNGSRDQRRRRLRRRGEILATTLFNFYRSIGGDHPNLGRRQFASRMAMYLIIRAIGNLDPAHNPQYAGLRQGAHGHRRPQLTSEGVRRRIPQGNPLGIPNSGASTRRRS